jgi:hypothetical protein
MAIMLAFQAGDTGSIPVTRSLRKFLQIIYGGNSRSEGVPLGLPANE